MYRIGMFVFACALLVVAGICTVRGARTAIAQAIYVESKYGLTKDDEEKVFANCERAYALYPYNYRFCTWTAEMAWYGRFDEDGSEIAARRALADYWCQRGLGLNPFRGQLRTLEVRLLMQEALREAVRKWEAYVEWHFWEPFNHAFLAELYALDGRYEDAIESLAWAKGSRYAREARQRVLDAWNAEIRAAATIR